MPRNTSSENTFLSGIVCFSQVNGARGARGEAESNLSWVPWSAAKAGAAARGDGSVPERYVTLPQTRRLPGLPSIIITACFGARQNRARATRAQMTIPGVHPHPAERPMAVYPKCAICQPARFEEVSHRAQSSSGPIPWLICILYFGLLLHVVILLVPVIESSSHAPPGSRLSPDVELEASPEVTGSRATVIVQCKKKNLA